MTEEQVNIEREFDAEAEAEALPPLMRMYERKLYSMRTLIDIGLSLSSNLNFDTLVDTILFSCIGQLLVEKVSLLLQIDIDVNIFTVHTTKGCEECETEGIKITDRSELYVFLNKNTVAHEFDELLKIDNIKKEVQDLKAVYPDLLIPMKSRESLNGILILGKKISGDKYTQQEKEFLQDLTRFAATAIENSRLYQMSTLDRMTRLYVHHYFQERMSEELQRSRRNRTPLCFILFDIDHFKKFNDTYGHQQGDVVIKSVANILKQCVRNVDIPARYGGEEYAVILPETHLNDAIDVAKRIRRAIEEYEFPADGDPLHVTVSLGVAQYDSDLDQTKGDFIKRADDALYKAKESGRNKAVAHRGQKKE